MTDFTNAPEGAGAGHSGYAHERHQTDATPIIPPQGGERANKATRTSAKDKTPAPTHPGNAGAAGQDQQAHKRRNDDASGNPPRKGRKAATCLLRDSAEGLTPPSEDCSDVATLVMRTSANVTTPIGANQSIEGEATASTCASAIGAKPTFDATGFVGLTRTRGSWLAAKNRLYLQSLSICRAACNGDKAAAVKLYKATISGDDTQVHSIISPMIEEIERWEARLKPIEKSIVGMIEASPIGAYVAREKGIGAISVGALLGHVGPPDLASSVPKFWRGCGLAVSECGTKRDTLIVPGEVDRRPMRAAVYVLATGAIKAGNPDLRAIYDREKAKALGKGWTKARAHNHGLRYVGKVITRRMWREWRNNTP